MYDNLFTALDDYLASQEEKVAALQQENEDLKLEIATFQSIQYKLQQKIDELQSKYDLLDHHGERNLKVQVYKDRPDGFDKPKKKRGK